jgi:cytochrome c oxidase assembly factor CtaG
MVQHMLLLLVAPPLLAMAIPPAFLGRLYRQPALARVLRFLWSPVTSLILFNGVLLIWHLPVAYDATLRYRWVHALEHVSFVAAGMIFWGVIVSPAPKLVRASYGVRLALVMAADLVNFLLGFGLAFAGRPLYLPYVRAARLWGLTPLDDLHLGGAVMWTMGQMMYAVPMLILLNVLLRQGGAGGAQAGASIHAADRGSEAPVNSSGPSVSSARP